MALDTPAKRHSALSWGQPWRTLPFPTGVASQGKRQAGAFCYSGILADILTQPTPYLCIDLPRRPTQIDLPRRPICIDLPLR